MGSAIVAIGDELVGGFTLDTNSHWLAGRLRAIGRPVKRIVAVRDRQDEIVDELRRALGDEEIEDVFTSGGLGPTADDRTAESVAALLGRPMVVNPLVEARIEQRTRLMREMGVVDDEATLAARARMARLPADPDQLLRNRRGVAPGMLFRVGGTRLYVLPGVPSELRSIFTDDIEPVLREGASPATLRELRLAGAMESQIAPIMLELERTHPDVSVGSYPRGPGQPLLIRCSGQDPARVEDAARRIVQAVAHLGISLAP